MTGCPFNVPKFAEKTGRVYKCTMCVDRVTVGLQPAWMRERWVALALFAMAGIGLVFTAYLTYLEAFVIHAWCQWCLVSGALVTLIFLFSIPGLRHAR